MSTSTKTSFLKDEAKELFRLKESSRHWSVPVFAALCVGIPLFVGLAIGKFSSALGVSLAGLVILYLPAQANVVGRMVKLLLCSFGFLVAYTIGLAFSFNPIVSCIAFGVFSTIVHWLSLSFKIAPPGNFFFIMLCALASGMPFDLEAIPERIGLVAMGTMLACFLALLNSLIFFKPDIKVEAKRAMDNVVVRKDADYIEALIIGFFMLCSLIPGYLFDLTKPYWIPISCLAVMQGASAAHVWRRGFYRVMGTVIGMAFCGIVLSIFKTPLGICIAIMTFQFIVESIVTRNYTLAVVFITPLTILLAEAGNPIADPAELITARVIDVIIGSLLGGIGGWVVHHEKIRYRAVKGIKLTRLALKRKTSH